MRRTKTAKGRADSKTRPGYSKKSLSQGTKEWLIAIGRLTRSPVFNVVALVALILAVFGGVRLLQARQAPAQLSFVEMKSDDPASSVNNDLSSSATHELFSGEVYDTTMRLRETSAVGIAVSLTVFAAYSEERNLPTGLDAIFEAIARRGLMPPGLVFANGELSSRSSKIIVRYQQKPLRFEILSHPKPNTEGPALMLRFPLPAGNGQTLSFFQSSASRRHILPEPFATNDQITASGWSLEQWRGELLPLDQSLLTALSEERERLVR